MELTTKGNVSQAIVVADGEDRVLKKPPKQVLDEDMYTASLDAIIKRDFFPELPKLRKQAAYIEASERGDHDAMERLRYEIQVESVRQQRGGKTPLGSVRSGRRETSQPAVSQRGGADSVRITPVGGTAQPTAWETPNAHGGEGAWEHGTPVQGGDGGGEEAAQVNLNMSLDAFTSKYTSEDNASFEQIIEETNERKKEKYKYLLDAEASAKEERSQLLLANDTGNRLRPWKYKAKNSLMYGPQGSDPRAFQPAITGKGINHKGTRISSGGTFKKPEAPASGLSPAPGGGLSTPSASPRVGGYGFMHTPSPLPGAGEQSPVMTWGDVSGTPLDLGPDASPWTGDSKFKIPETPSRDQTLLKLNEGVQKKKKQLAQNRYHPYLEKSPLNSPALSKTTLKSPMAKSLLKRSSSSDFGLRSAYQSPTARAFVSPSRDGRRSSSGAFRSPVAISPMASKRKSTGAAQGDGSTDSTKKSITDNLLNI